MRRASSALWLLSFGLVLTLLLFSGEPLALAEGSPTPAVGPLSLPVSEPGPDNVPLLPPFPFSRGYHPIPVDLSHLKGDRMPDGVSSAALPSRWDWRDQGMVTPVGNQNPCGACYSFAFLGAFESKLLRDGAGAFNFSENQAKECNWEELNDYSPGSWGSCSGGNAQMMVNLFRQAGTVLEECDPFVPEDVGCKGSCPYQKTVLGWNLICGSVVPDTNVLKAYIYDYGPVHASLNAGGSSIIGCDAWCQEFSAYNGSYTLYHPGGGEPDHAVLIVGWDDNLTHAGGQGAWIAKNSWGTDWGNAGYFSIAYGSASIGMDSGFISEWQDYDADGGLLSYDDAGWNVMRGTGLTAWALVKFVPPASTSVTHVEFWTTDATTDVDVYLYDSFDGNAPSNLLFTRENLAFAEAGYHSVPISPAVAVAAGNDIVAVVQLTNVSYTKPLAIDGRGPPETGRTFRSYSGASGSWGDLGTAYGEDLTIRLRTSNASPTATLSPTAMPTLTPSATRKPVTPAAWIYLPVLMKRHVPAAGPTVTPTRSLVPSATGVDTRTPTATQMPAGTPTRTPTSSPGEVVVVPLSGGPYSLAVNSDNNRLYIARSAASDVAVLDLSTLELVTNRALDKGPHVVRVNPGLGRVYAAYGNPLYVFSSADHSLLGQVATGVYNAYELAIDSSNHRIYVGDWTTIVGQQDKVHVYDGTTNSLIGSVDLGVSADIERMGLAVNRSTGLAYAAYTGDNKIAVIGYDLALRDRITTSQMAAYPWLVVNAATNHLYLRGEDETIVIDLNSNTEVGTLSHTGLIAVDETRDRIYVLGTSKVYVYDGATNLSLRDLVLDKYRYMTDIAFDPATHRVLLAAPNDDVIVSVVD